MKVHDVTEPRHQCTTHAKKIIIFFEVHNVFSLQDEFSRVYQEKEAVLLTNIYGTITRFDIDQDKVR